MKFIVFGLGSFGASLGTKLVALGHEVIGIDKSVEVAERWKDSITHTIALDASSRDAMETLPVKEVDCAVVAIGETPGISIMIAALAKQLGAPRIICRVVDDTQQTVLESMGIDEFTYPESDSAERLAYRLDLKGVVESYKISDEYHLLEVAVPDRYVGTRVSEINFVGEHHVQLLTVIRPEKQRNLLGTVHTVRKAQGIISSDIELAKEDTLLLFGEVKRLEEFIGQYE
ncbi:MAG: TrkA family potassium uptake protein [Cyclobacteriaceae bacterium]|jgi:trk system potassium uptake protein TrkA|nr:TrkA family potassium uptake protein [Cyclobacteriaceae bacterium]